MGPALPFIALGLQGLSGAIGAFGQIEQGRAAAGAAHYNASVALQNAQVAKQNAAIAGQSGAAQAGISEQKTRAMVGNIKANQAASNIRVNRDSAVDVRSSAEELGQLDAITVRSNATRVAYGYEVQGKNLEAQSTLDEFEAKNAIRASEIGAASTLLGAAGNAGTTWQQFQLEGAMSA